MGININSNFSVGAPVPIDSRLVLGYDDMLSMNDNIMPEVYLTVCRDDGELYMYNKNNTPNTITGKFVKLLVDGMFGGSIEFINRTTFPEIGDDQILYIAVDENIIYRWDNTLSEYVGLSTANIDEDTYVRTTDNLILNCTL